MCESRRALALPRAATASPSVDRLEILARLPTWAQPCPLLPNPVVTLSCSGHGSGRGCPTLWSRQRSRDGYGDTRSWLPNPVAPVGADLPAWAGAVIWGEAGCGCCCWCAARFIAIARRAVSECNMMPDATVEWAGWEVLNNTRRRPLGRSERRDGRVRAAQDTSRGTGTTGEGAGGRGWAQS